MQIIMDKFQTFQEAYNMTYLTAQDWDSTYKKIAKDDELFKKYFQ